MKQHRIFIALFIALMGFGTQSQAALVILDRIIAVVDEDVVMALVTPADTGIFFEFQLKGLSTLGRRLDSLLEQSIPGYRNREDLIGQ